MADDTLSTVAHTVARISRCEDAGTPHASVLASVTLWRSPKGAVRQLKAWGWTPPTEGVTLSSPDGRYVAQMISLNEGDGTPSHVAIYFYDQPGVS